jgi:hypothetical protein
MAVVNDEAVACELAADFQNDLKECEVFSLEDYTAAPTWRRLLDSVWRLASPLL